MWVRFITPTMVTHHQFIWKHVIICYFPHKIPKHSSCDMLIIKDQVILFILFTMISFKNNSSIFTAIKMLRLITLAPSHSHAHSSFDNFYFGFFAFCRILLYHPIRHLIPWMLNCWQWICLWEKTYTWKWELTYILHIFASPKEKVTFLCILWRICINGSYSEISRGHVFANLGENRKN